MMTEMKTAPTIGCQFSSRLQLLIFLKYVYIAAACKNCKKQTKSRELTIYDQIKS